MLQEVTLYRKNSIGIGVWNLSGAALTSRNGQILIRHSVVEGGSWVTHVDPVNVNNSGRTIEEQIALEMNSRVKRQLDKGYKRTRAEAMEGATNQLGMPNPMLAQRLDKVKLTGSHFMNAYVQPKFDGHRCLITKQNGDMLAYSRKGNVITTVGHLLEELEPIMQDGDTVDGELYIHGTALQTIGSYVKREQPGSRLLKYHWYDMIVHRPFHERFQLMQDLHSSLTFGGPIELVPTERVQKMSDVYAHFRKMRAMNMEGTMLRLSIAGYEDGSRAMQLIKVKERIDGEVLTIGVRPSVDGWAILRVRFNDKEFDIAAPGSVPEKTEVLKNYESKYHNRLLTIEYAMLTNDGVPFHAVATRWREDI